ncbi:hypothetical protein ACXR0O_25750 [Verrucomicrobiota bacterium sgz303538]
MISIDTDTPKQLLIIRFEQTVSAQDAEAAVGRVRRCLQELSAGFCLLADFCDLTCMEDECAPFIMQVMDICAAKGIARVYRIMPDPTKDIGLNVMSLFHYGHDVHILNFENKEEAEAALERLGPQSSR